MIKANYARSSLGKFIQRVNGNQSVMNAVIPRFLKLFYRKEPVISSLMTMGVVDALIGGLDDSWSLFAFGLGTAGVALAFKLWRIQQHNSEKEEPIVQYYLPSHSSNTALPVVNVSKKKPPKS